MARPIRHILLAAALLGFCSAAQAQQGAAASDAEQATQHYNRGRELYNQGDYAGAIQALQKAYDLAPSPTLLFNLGKAHEQAGNRSEAATFYERYLKDSGDPSDRAAVEATIKRLRSGQEPATPASPSVADRAEEHYRKGRTLYAEGDYRGSLLELTAAYELVPASALVYNMAKAREKLGDYGGALKDYRRYLQMEPAATDKLDVEALIRALETRIRELHTELTLESTPSGADVFLDGAERIAGQTPLTLKITAGQHKLKVVKNGYETSSREFVMPDDRPLTLNFDLRPLENVGYLTVDCDEDGAHLFLDGTLVALTPYRERRGLSAGRHQLVLDREGFNRFSKVVDIYKDKETRVRVSLASSSGRSKAPVLLAPLLGLPLVGVALVGHVASLVFGLKATLAINGTEAWKRNLVGFGVGEGVAAAFGLTGVLLTAVVVTVWVLVGLIPRGGEEITVVPIRNPPAAPAAPPAPAAAVPPAVSPPAPTPSASSEPAKKGKDKPAKPSAGGKKK